MLFYVIRMLRVAIQGILTGALFIFFFHYYYYYHPIKVQSLKSDILLSGYFRNAPYNRGGKPATSEEVAWPEHATLCSIISRSLFQRGEKRQNV